MSEPPMPDPLPADEAATATPVETAAAAAAEVAAAARTEAEDSTRGQISLGERLRQPRTIISIVLPIVILVLIFRIALKVDVQELIHGIAVSNKLALLAAFGIFYLGFPLRGLRWAKLLRGTGTPITVRDSTEILFLSWFINCLVPAKLGDLYRAYLVKLNGGTSGSTALGTVVIERVLDLFVIAILGLAAGFWSFRNGFPPEIQFVAVLGIGVLIMLAVLLLTLRNFGRRFLELLRLPHRILDMYDRFEEGVFGAMGARSIPGLVALSGLIWMTEGLRLYFVVLALGFPDVQLGLSGAFFVALIGSLLTAVPLSPAGLGTVELGVVAVLTLAYGIGAQEAATIVVVDRLISVFSVIVFGAVVYLFSGKRKGEGLAPMRGAQQPA